MNIDVLGGPYANGAIETGGGQPATDITSLGLVTVVDGEYAAVLLAFAATRAHCKNP